MPIDPPWPTFHLEIASLDDFVAFVALIRGDDLGLLLERVRALNTSTEALAAAAAKALTTDPPTT